MAYNDIKEDALHSAVSMWPKITLSLKEAISIFKNAISALLLLYDHTTACANVDGSKTTLSRFITFT